MDQWRIKAIEFFPEKELEFSNIDLPFSVYELYYRNMLAMWEEAAIKEDLKLAQKIISFVEWGLADEDYDVRNAATVSFLEHIPDKPLRLHFAEQIMPEHLYRRAIESSASLRKRDSDWHVYLKESLSRYKEIHSIELNVNWPRDSII